MVEQGFEPSQVLKSVFITRRFGCFQGISEKVCAFLAQLSIPSHFLVALFGAKNTDEKYKVDLSPSYGHKVKGMMEPETVMTP